MLNLPGLDLNIKLDAFCIFSCPQSPANRNPSTSTDSPYFNLIVSNTSDKPLLDSKVPPNSPVSPIVYDHTLLVLPHPVSTDICFTRLKKSSLVFLLYKHT